MGGDWQVRPAMCPMRSLILVAEVEREQVWSAKGGTVGDHRLWLLGRQGASETISLGHLRVRRSCSCAHVSARVEVVPCSPCLKLALGEREREDS
jgi:hypothetical protein